MLFNRRFDNRLVDGAIHYKLAPNAVSSRHFLFGLSPGLTYRLTTGPEGVALEPGERGPGQSLVVDHDGILRFALPPVMAPTGSVETGGRSARHS